MDAQEHQGSRETTWIITIEDKSLDRLDDIAEQLKDSGLRLDNVLRSLGQISGRSRAADSTVFSRVEGVASVHRERTISIAPPDSQVQ